MTGSSRTRLILLRGNSASGKSSVAACVRERFGRGVAIVAQDNLRRIVLREHDRPGAPNIGLIDTVARYSLDSGYHTVVEGLMYADRYGDMLTRLLADHRGVSRAYYLDVPLDETLRRHATKPIAAEVGEAEVSSWYRQSDLLPGAVEKVIGAGSTLEETVDLVMRESGLPDLAPQAR